MSLSRFISPLLTAICALFLLMTSHIQAQGTDTDGDGMLDTWETSMGLNPNDATDALTDKDGDRIPNLWEHDRGTQANLATSVPAWDATVDASLSVNAPSSGEFTNFQDAYDSLTGGSYRSIVRVKKGYYSSGLSGQFDPKKVAWIADVGPVKATVEVPLSASGITVSDDTVMDGLVVQGGFPYELIEDSYTLGLVRCIRHSSFTTNRRLRMVTCIVRRGIHANPDTLEADALYLKYFDAVLEHCTFAHNNLSEIGVPSRTSGSIHKENGALTIKNSIIWGDGYQLHYSAPPSPIIVNSVITGINYAGTSAPTYVTPNSSFLNPRINKMGYPSGLPLTVDGQPAGQAVVQDKVFSGSPALDIHGQSRPIGSAAERGAVEWEDTDDDGLADWWELHHFYVSGQSSTYHLRYLGTDGVDGGTTPLDADDFNNWTELEFDLDPNVFNNNEGETINYDYDGDGMYDPWEVQYFGDLSAMPLDDADADGLTNFYESQHPLDHNPTVHWNDRDQDGMWDTGTNSEQDYFGNLAQGYNDDYDGDGVGNGLEMYVYHTDPTNAGLVEYYYVFATLRGMNISNTDFDEDGLSFEDELALGTNPLLPDTDGDGVEDGDDPSPLVADAAASQTKISISGAPVLSLVTPANAIEQ